MYYEYWKLQKPPFDNVPDPAMYVRSHASLENAIAETLFAIEEGNECLSVIVGDVGLGKTLSLRLIIDSLKQEKYRIALVTNPGISFIQLLREIIGQLAGTLCLEKKKADLLEAFNKILFETADEGKKVLVFIDEANAIRPADLENLRLLTNMQDDRRNLFTIVLAGQMELVKRLENPKRTNLFQRIGTFSRIERIPSEDSVKAYVETRLRLAGGTSQIFTDEAVSCLWEYSDHGVPRLINKLAKLCLKAGETNGFERIDGETVRRIGERFRNLAGQVVRQKENRGGADEIVLLQGGIRTPEPERSCIGEAMPEETAPESCGPEATPDGLEGPVPDIQVRILPPAASEMPAADPEETPAHEDSAAPLLLPEGAAETGGPQDDGCETLLVRELDITIEIPPELLRDAPYLDHDQRLRSAGYLAAQILKGNPELTSGPAADPINIWSEIRDAVLGRLEREQKSETCTAQAAM